MHRNAFRLQRLLQFFAAVDFATAVHLQKDLLMSRNDYWALELATRRRPSIPFSSSEWTPRICSGAILVQGKPQLRETTMSILTLLFTLRPRLQLLRDCATVTPARGRCKNEVHSTPLHLGLSMVCNYYSSKGQRMYVHGIRDSTSL